jgi:beta-galactosidase/beta-glucuronidase
VEKDGKLMEETVGAMHPNPQLARQNWIDLRGVWGFCHDDEGQGLDERWHLQPERFDRSIVVPFPPESRASGIGDTGYHPRVWYHREFALHAPSAGQRVILHFGAVEYRADVWVDGQHVAAHEGGHTPFAADVTAALRTGESHAIVVRAEDDPRDLAQPRGKQDWRPEPHVIWYHRTTGIWQPVWIEVVGAAHIVDLRWTPDLRRNMLGMTIALNGPADVVVHARIRLSLHGNVFVDDMCLVPGATLYREFAIDHPALDLERDQVQWSPEHPNLVEAAVSLITPEGESDAVQSYAGIRSVGVSHGRFWLNGSPLFLRLALEQGYWPDSHLAAPSDAALREEVEIARSLGFNGVRVHQKVEDPRFLYWCDCLGLLVWGEMPNAYVYTRDAVERLTREWLEVLRRDYSHPCIVAWVPINESWGVPNLLGDPAQRDYIQALYHLTRALDTTRPVIGNEGWEHAASDIHGIHDYTFDGQALRDRYGTPDAMEHTIRHVQPQHHVILLPEAVRRDQPVMITEFGGIGFKPGAGEPWFGYGTVQTPEEFAAKYAELVTAIVDSPSLAGFCYTQLTDTLQETNGLVTDRRVPKVDAAVLRAITERVSGATPGDAVQALQHGATKDSAQDGGAIDGGA